MKYHGRTMKKLRFYSKNRIKFCKPKSLLGSEWAMFKIYNAKCQNPAMFMGFVYCTEEKNMIS